MVLVKKEIEKMKKWRKNANGNNYMINSVVKDLIKFVQKSYLALTKKKGWSILHLSQIILADLLHGIMSEIQEIIDKVVCN